MTRPPTAARRSGLKAQERRTGFLLLVPALLAFALVILVPFLQSMRLSLYKYTIDMERPAFVGLANFTRLLADPGTATIWVNTLVFVVLTTGLTFLLGLGWALMMNQSFKGRAVVRAASLFRCHAAAVHGAAAQGAGPVVRVPLLRAVPRP